MDKEDNDIYSKYGNQIGFYSLIILLFIGFIFVSIGSLKGYAFIFGGIVSVDMNVAWIGAFVVLFSSIFLVIMLFYFNSKKSEQKPMT